MASQQQIAVARISTPGGRADWRPNLQNPAGHSESMDTVGFIPTAYSQLAGDRAMGELDAAMGEKKPGCANAGYLAKGPRSGAVNGCARPRAVALGNTIIRRPSQPSILASTSGPPRLF
ncbi:hypothetical protein MW887_004909 [Aspergillus wentii]|nr:hypothetical protein MW887_004909 [Aspergillus wentii]